jgi:hypothetical protein
LATFSLWTTGDLSDNDRTIRVYRLKTAFDESSATWNQSASGVNWQSAGASGANDRESTDIGSVLVLANETDGTEKQISLNNTKVQEMVSGAFTNHGFIIIADTELNDRFNYKSSDSSTSSIDWVRASFQVVCDSPASAEKTPGFPLIAYPATIPQHQYLHPNQASENHSLPRRSEHWRALPEFHEQVVDTSQ